MHSTRRTVCVGPHKLTQLEGAALFGYATGLTSEQLSKRLGSPAGSLRTTIARICVRLGIENNRSAALAYCLFHEVITPEQLFEACGMTKKRRAA